MGCVPFPLEALEATSNVTRGKRRLKMRGSWCRWWPLEKPKKLSRSELELWRPNTVPATELPPTSG